MLPFKMNIPKRLSRIKFEIGLIKSLSNLNFLKEFMYTQFTKIHIIVDIGKFARILLRLKLMD